MTFTFPDTFLISSEFVPSYTIVTISSGPLLTFGVAVAGISVFFGAGVTLCSLLCSHAGVTLCLLLFFTLFFTFAVTLTLQLYFFAPITACTVALPFLMPFTVQLVLFFFTIFTYFLPLLTFHFTVRLVRLLFFSLRTFLAPTATFAVFGRVTFAAIAGTPAPILPPTIAAIVTAVKHCLVLFFILFFLLLQSIYFLIFTFFTLLHFPYTFFPFERA